MVQVDTQAAGYTYAYPRPAVTADVVVYAVLEGRLSVLLVRRGGEPFRGCWALPGGFVDADEPLEAAALRELLEETGLTDVWLEQLYTFGELQRDPRGRVITVAYYAAVHSDRFSPLPPVDGTISHLFSVHRLPSLAFDHPKIISYALERLKHKVNYTTICFQLVPERFTLSELQKAYEVILGQKLDKRNFRKKMLQLNILKSTDEKRISGPQRPAQLYSFIESKVLKLQERGILVPF